MKFTMIPKEEFNAWYKEMTKRVDARLEKENKNYPFRGLCFPDMSRICSREFPGHVSTKKPEMSHMY